MIFTAIFKKITENERVNERKLFVIGDNLTKYCVMTGKGCEI